jgi:hypothetical protein
MGTDKKSFRRLGNLKKEYIWSQKTFIRMYERNYKRGSEKG